MDNQTTEPIPPLRLEEVVPGSVSLQPNAAQPNEMILSAQVKFAPSPDIFTLMLHVERADAQRLVEQLQDELCSNCQRPAA